MNELIFKGKVRKGQGRFSKLIIPTKSMLTNRPETWPENLCPGSLNIGISDLGYPDDFNIHEGVKELDAGCFKPVFIIPENKIPTNDKGDAQVWRAKLIIKSTGTIVPCWVLRRICSGIKKQLEIVSEYNLRDTYGLIEGQEVEVILYYES